MYENKVIGECSVQEIAHGLVGMNGDLFFRIQDYMEEKDIPYTADDAEAIFDDVMTCIEKNDYKP